MAFRRSQVGAAKSIARLDAEVLGTKLLGALIGMLFAVGRNLRDVNKRLDSIIELLQQLNRS